MMLTTSVRLVLAESPASGIPGVKVSLFDRDTRDEDDLLGTAVTGDKGEIFFGFDAEKYTDSEDQPLWRLDSLPDLYVVVYDAGNRVVLSTRSEAIEDKLPELITVPVSREIVEKHGLMHKP